MEYSPEIKQLPNHLIDQIKAGEVIEQPASILKELIENSLDAGASKINVQIENNGLDLIAVEDNGHGMSFEDLPKAFGRHATSKLNRFEDLYKLNSFGFRGEALASMGSISRVTCSSSPNSGKGGKIVIHGGVIESHVEFTSENGTSINIRDLFYNTPVRLKFIKSKVSEKNAIWKALNSFILSNPHVSFSIKYGDGDKTIYAPQENIEDRIKQVFKKNKKSVDDFISIQGEYEGHKIFGMVNPSSSRGSSKNLQFLFANKRLFSDKALHSAVTKGMDGIWNPGETGSYCLMLHIPPSYIDVNIHPRKTEIKFFKPSIVFSLVQSSIEKCRPKKTFSFEEKTIEGNFGENFSMTNTWEAGETESIPGLVKITESFLLLNHGGRPYLIHVPALFKKYMELKVREVVESETTPLLIAEPYPMVKGPLDKRLSELASFGFILERADDENLLAKSVPNYLSELPVRNILGNFLSSLEKAPNKALKVVFQSEENIKTTIFSLQQIHLMLKPFLSSWGSSSFAKPLNDEVLDRIYH
jgi:DNA mismatch repair protein MutL